MRRVMLLAVALAVAPGAFAQLYKHVDKDGRVTYSDKPPAGADAKPVHLPKSVTDAPSGPKSYVEKDKELDKKRKELKEKSTKADEAAARAQEDEQRCQHARTNYQTYAQGGRIYKIDEKGERVFMGDADIERERERTRREMEEACKGR